MTSPEQSPIEEDSNVYELSDAISARQNEEKEEENKSPEKSLLRQKLESGKCIICDEEITDPRMNRGFCKSNCSQKYAKTNDLSVLNKELGSMEHDKWLHKMADRHNFTFEEVRKGVDDEKKSLNEIVAERGNQLKSVNDETVRNAA